MARYRLGRSLPALLLCLALPLAAADVVRGGYVADPITLDPAQAWDDTSTFYVANIFDTLVRFDPRSLRIEPSLASRWQTSADGLTWTFHLRRDVRFHDGTPLDAEAVVFSFQRQMDPANPKRREEFPLFHEIFTRLAGVRALDAQRVQFVLREPFFPFLAALTADCAAVVSPPAVRRLGAEFARRPVGSGPYKLRSWQPGKRLVLEANAGYWRGRPRIAEFTGIIEPQAELLGKHFAEGTIDLLSTFSISKMASYRKQDWVRISSEPLYSVTFLVLNSSRPLLRSRLVRQALAHAWDPRILKLVYQDYILPIHTLLPPGLAPVGTAAKPPLEFSLARARELLKQEGWKTDQPLELLVRRQEGLFFQVLSMYARNLRQAGVSLRLTRLEPEELARRVAANDFDLAYSSWIADYPDPDSMLYPLMSRELQQQGFATAASSGRHDLLQRLVAARREGDAQKRLQGYLEIDRALVGEALILPVYQAKRVILLNRSKLGGIGTHPLGKLLLFDLRAP